MIELFLIYVIGGGFWLQAWSIRQARYFPHATRTAWTVGLVLNFLLWPVCIAIAAYREIENA